MKLLIVFNIIGFVAAFYNSTLVLLDRNGNELGYGVIVARDTVLLPKSSDGIFQQLNMFARLDNWVHAPNRNQYRHMNRRDLNHGIKYKLTSHKLKKINDEISIIKLSNNSKVTEGNRNLGISRHPICDSSLLSTIKVNYRYTAMYTENTSDVFQYNSSIQCKSNISSINHKNQICKSSLLSDDSKPGAPFVTFVEEMPFLVGRLIESFFEKSFDLLVEKCDEFPIYDSCSFLLSSMAKYAKCNSMAISKDLFNSSHPEIILIGNTENRDNFVPSGFAVIVSDNQVIAFSDFIKVLEQQNNPEIYGNGERKDVEFMINERQQILEKMVVTDIGINKFKLLTFGKKPFEGMQRATFSFHETFTIATDFTNFETLQFIEINDHQKLVVENGSNSESSFKLSLGAPVFQSGNVVGFQEYGTFYSAFEVKEFLEQNVPTLLYVSTTTTPTTEMPAFSSSSTASPPSQTTTELLNTTLETNSTLNLKSSNSISPSLSFFVLGFTILFFFL